MDISIYRNVKKISGWLQNIFMVKINIFIKYVVNIYMPEILTYLLVQTIFCVQRKDDFFNNSKEWWLNSIH